MMKKVVSILLVLILFFSFVDVVNASNPPEENVSFYVSDEVYQSISEKKEENQTFAEQSIALNEYFSITQQLDDEQLGGAFFDDDNKLHVLLTEDVPIAMSLTTNICYDMVPYSYKQLQTFQNIIINRRGEIGFDSCGIVKAQRDSEWVSVFEKEYQYNGVRLRALKSPYPFSYLVSYLPMEELPKSKRASREIAKKRLPPFLLHSLRDFLKYFGPTGNFDEIIQDNYGAM